MTNDGRGTDPETSELIARVKRAASDRLAAERTLESDATAREAYESYGRILATRTLTQRDVDAIAKSFIDIFLK